jgi:hypothetical protein
MQSSKLVAMAAFAILAIAACGGSGATTTTGSATPIASVDAGASLSPPPSEAAASATPAASAGPVDTCALISTADLNSATGADYGDGVLDEFGQCFWRVGGATANNGDGQVVIAIQDASLDTIKSTFTGGTDTNVSGHAAYWHPATSLQSMWVDIGGRTLVLSFDPVGPDSQAVAQKVAEIAVGKL